VETVKLEVDQEMEGSRLDVFIHRQIPELSRTLIADLVKTGRVAVEGQTCKASYRLKPGEEVMVSIPEARTVEVKAQEIPLNIVYEDQDLAVIDKPQGMVVHPAQGNWENTLVNALLFQIKDLSGINGEIRPGIVHRLDKDTSGLLVVAKNDRAHRKLADQIREHSFTREYTALVHGQIKEQRGRVEAPIGRSPRDRKKMAVVNGGREAITEYEVIHRYQDYTLVRCRLKTGRTHQIRVHMAYLGHPVVGDPLYGPKKNAFHLSGQALHASRLEITHPVTGEIMGFTSPLPYYFEELLARIR
jgi:23S rRNA pseudouridine1911/1915/1917 synthase